jgi:VanZ family protein
MPPGRFTFPSLWLLTILILGTSYFAAANTGPLVLPFLKSLAPGASTAKLHAIHMVLRKLAHLTEYAVLALLWFRALLSQAQRAPRAAVWSALAVCIVCAIADEAHQSTIPERYGSVRDVVIDVSGAASALLVARGRMAARERAQVRSRIAVEPVE